MPHNNNHELTIQIESTHESRMKHHHEEHHEHNKHAWRFIWCVIGIYASFMIGSVFQEKISSTKYLLIHDSHTKPIEDMFVHPIFIVFVTCLVNVIYSVIRLMIYSPDVFNQFTRVVTRSEIVKFMFAGLFYVLGTLLSYASLNYVSYPTQVLTKSCKLLPIMLGTIIVARKSYPTYRYVFVIVISCAIAFFMLDRISGHSADAAEDDYDRFRIGIAMLVASLFIDGITNAIQTVLYQELQNKKDQQLHSDLLMLYVNLFSTGFIFICCLFYNNELFESIKFLRTHDGITRDLSLQCITKGIGQAFVFMTITSFGPLISGLVCTTRKFFTILFSIAYYRHTISNVQWMCIIAVFGSILFDLYLSQKDKLKKRPSDQGVLTPVSSMGTLSPLTDPPFVEKRYQ
jgi:UDP-galactose transporter B1